MMRIATFNVNSIRSRVLPVLKWLAENKPDVLCVQETKVQDHEFPCQPFADAGYNFVFCGQKSYNGVALFSKNTAKNVRMGFDEEPRDCPRLIAADFGGVTVVNTYVPQGYARDSEKFEYKLKWFGRLREFFEKNFSPRDKIVWVGDLNVAPDERDVYDPKRLFGHVCFCPEVTTALNEVVEWGFVDLFRKYNEDSGQFSFWDYRMPNTFERNRGWRLDHIFATEPLAKMSIGCWIDKTPRGLMTPSDHAPVYADFDVK